MERSLAIEAAPGVLADSPGAAFDALADLAEADGADRDAWVTKALAHAGASRASVVVRGEPRFRVIEDATHRADAVFKVAVDAALREIVALLQGQADKLPDDPTPGA
jgi:hypothetical protein